MKNEIYIVLNRFPTGEYNVKQNKILFLLLYGSSTRMYMYGWSAYYWGLVMCE